MAEVVLAPRIDAQSKNVKRFVCRMFKARSASRSAITQDILISLAPFID